MIQYIWGTCLYSLGLLIGFLFLPFIRPKPIDENYGIELDKKYDALFIAFTLSDELEEAPDSCLTEEELLALRDKVLRYEIPYVNLQVILFYDHEKQYFGYYASSSIIHKYLNVAARKYVLEYGCKQIYKETVPSVQRTEKETMSGPFVSKPTKSFMEKEINRFHYLGNLYDFDPETRMTPKKITFSEYLRRKQD